MSISVLIADDDMGIRLVLKKAVEKADGFTIVGEAADGETALRLYGSLRPDMVFLDVQMPLMSGIDCAKRISDINPKTIIIFVTAYEEYMPEAFEVYAFDYLTKPFKLERLNRTLNRIKSYGIAETGDTEASVQSRQRKPEKLMIRNKDGITLVDTADIILIQREDGNTAIYTANDRFITSESLGELEGKLAKDLFFRSHKSYIVNLENVSKISPYGRWTYMIKLKGTDKDALLTREKYDELGKIFK